MALDLWRGAVRACGRQPPAEFRCRQVRGRRLKLLRPPRPARPALHSAPSRRKHSHRRHHSNTGSLSGDEVFVPPVKEEVRREGLAGNILRRCGSVSHVSCG